ncbi:hypothetical protein V495_05891 [Pseudogymnoascus sp. VKM F-4514 (FW-929)]|nr:hypothetical protein V495_05891 [Pseudogymnoascus sp. VKM F-4514 (FW-929)]KFY56081.1 hypothetical protein V497_06530 [Pseudogymnoascus sp. VKM F-4516 (FW-969)]
MQPASASEPVVLESMNDADTERLNAKTSKSPFDVARPRKLRRVTRACDFCHRRSTRCKQSQESQDDSRCQNCLDFDIACTFERPARKRGSKRQRQAQIDEDGSSSGEHANLLLQMMNSHVDDGEAHSYGKGNRGTVEMFTFPLATEYRDMVLDNPDIIQDLVSVYFEVVYPIFPFFHRPTFLQKITTKRYLSDRGLFAVVMAICALASARARDGALIPGQWAASHFNHPSSESFYSAARDVTPHLDLSAMEGIDWMRMCALLSLLGIQDGNINVMHQYLGLYHTLAAMDGLHDEKNWPKDIGIVEIEERRRLFWSMYTLEVYSSLVWAGITRCRQSQCRVFYPSEVDDESFSDKEFSNLLPQRSPHQGFEVRPGPAIDTSSWLHGWNFITDLYVVLEHAMDSFHGRRPQTTAHFSPGNMFNRVAPSQSAVLDKVMWMHQQLPDRFKETQSVTFDTAEGRLSFQAANIAATLQLVRMVLFTAEEATVGRKCAIARELLDEFAKVPVFFLRAISSPLLYHLAGIGSILGSVMEGPLSESSYLQARTVLLAMADLLSNLEIGMTRTSGATQRLRLQVTRIDEYMAEQRQQNLAQPQSALPESVPSMPDSNLHKHVDMFGEEQQQSSRGAQQVGYDFPSNPQGTGHLGNRQDYVPIQMSADTYNIESMPDGISGLDETSQQLQFQLPPELLDDWPWLFDMA